MDKDSDSTVTSLDGNTENFCDNPTRDILADGIINVIKPVVDKLDEQVRLTRISQKEVDINLNSLLQELKNVEEIQSRIPDYNEKVAKLISTRHKINVVVNILQNCEARLNVLHQQLEAKLNKQNFPTPQ